MGDPGHLRYFQFVSIPQTPASGPPVHTAASIDSLVLRWAGLDPDYTGAPPQAHTQLVSLSDLEKKLPPGTPRMDAAGRREQMAKHKADYASWLGDG